MVLGVKNPPADAGYVRDVGKILGQEDSPGGGLGNPLQSSCLGNPMDRGAWKATVHKVIKSRTRLKRLCTQTHNCTLPPSLGPSLYGSRRDKDSECWKCSEKERQPSGMLKEAF